MAGCFMLATNLLIYAPFLIKSVQSCTKLVVYMHLF